ncbi:MAG TPA: hypothetical protein VGP76_30215 [Planctomycetaceae bacterium]|jgi:hypothetical protein|nr:hypothetical protein [Planctomycetaceae bacterium]
MSIGAVLLNQHPVIDGMAERGWDRSVVGVKAVSRDVGRCWSAMHRLSLSAKSAAFSASRRPTWKQNSNLVSRSIAVKAGVSAALKTAVKERSPFFLLDERPNFIALDFGDRQILHRVGQKLVALPAGLDHDPENRVLVEIGQPRRGTDARAFQEQLQRERGLLGIGRDPGKRFGF